MFYKLLEQLVFLFLELAMSASDTTASGKNPRRAVAGRPTDKSKSTKSKENNEASTCCSSAESHQLLEKLLSSLLEATRNTHTSSPCNHQLHIDLDKDALTLSNMSRPLQPGMKAPNFKGTAVVEGEFKDIKLEDYRGKYLVFFFYPLDFTFVCPTEIRAFSERAGEFRAIGCEVVACSTDSHFSHLAWVNTPANKGGLGDMQIPILADKTGSVARSYGVLKEDEGISFRGLFIINEEGILRQITVNDLPVGRSVDEALRLVQAFKFTDEHGEVCPAGWKPGSKTIKPSVKGAQDYFKTVK